MACRAPWITWWISSTSSWWSLPRSRSTSASWSSFPYYSSPPGTPCTSCTRTRPRENAALTHKEQTGPTHPGMRDACQHWLHSAPVKWMSPSCSLSNLIATLHSRLSHSFQHNTASACPSYSRLLSSYRATAANKNSGEIEWETRSPFVYISWGGYNKCSKGTSRGKCPFSSRQQGHKGHGWGTSTCLCKPCRITARLSSNKPVNLHSFFGWEGGWMERFF